MNQKSIRLHNEANNAALEGDFKKAIGINEAIIAEFPHDVDAHLRLGFAFMQLSDFVHSKKAYKKALKFEPLNQIAKNNLDKITILEKRGKQPLKAGESQDVVIDPNLFLNIIGKTKEVSLVNIGQADTLAHLKVGENVFFKIKKRRLEVRNKENEYIGALPDDISKRLMFFLDAKSTYSIFIKSTAKNNVDVFIREEKKGRKVKNYTSFPKNIQDDLKVMMGDGTEEETSPTEEVEETDTQHVDIEQLADQLDTETYGESQSDQFEEEEE